MPYFSNYPVVVVWNVVQKMALSDIPGTKSNEVIKIFLILAVSLILEVDFNPFFMKKIYFDAFF